MCEHKNTTPIGRIGSNIKYRCNDCNEIITEPKVKPKKKWYQKLGGK